MTFNVPHNTTKDAAVARVKEALRKARAEIGDKATIDEERWEGDTLHFAFTAQGQSISGTLHITDTNYDAEIKLPLMLRMFEGKIKSMIEAEVTKMLGAQK